MIREPVMMKMLCPWPHATVSQSAYQSNMRFRKGV
jgi:hypothetical protein